jgi:outer membrane protein insertion porin family
LATETLTASLIYSYAETILSTDTSKFTVYHSTFSNSGLAFLYDTRDDYYVPTKGFFVNLNLIYSRKNILGPARFIADKKNLIEGYLRVESSAGIFVSVTRKMVAALKFNYHQISGQSLEVSDLYKFGGAKSVRGYRFEQFSGDKIGWSNFECRFLFSQDSYAFLFFDSGYYYNQIIKEQNRTDYKQFIYGYGVGLNFPTGLGNMSVSFALGKGDSFSNGKLNFGIVNRF